MSPLATLVAPLGPRPLAGTLRHGRAGVRWEEPLAAAATMPEPTAVEELRFVAIEIG